MPWLGWTCGVCSYCVSGRENLCDNAKFTGYTLDGGYAQYTLADERFCFRIPGPYSDAEAAPLLCAGLIGYQRQRRALIAIEDQIVETVHVQIRQLRVLADNYRIQQRAVELAYFQGLSQREISRQTGVPLGTVKTRTSSALKRLRKGLAVGYTSWEAMQ